MFSTPLFSFWNKAPALETAFYLFLGAGICLGSSCICLLLGLTFLGIKSLALPHKKAIHHSIVYGMLLILLGAGYTYYFMPPEIKENSRGRALLKIIEKRPSTFFGKTSLYYKAHLILFETEDLERYEHLDCIFSLKPHAAITADSNYYVSSVTLSHTAQGTLRLKVNKDSRWIPIEGTHSMVEWRYNQKCKAQRQLETSVKNAHVLKFLSAMTLGYLDSKTLCYEFSRVGLQHLLTISGFHFALLALFISFFLKPFCSKKIRAPIILFLLTVYVLYLGPAPSVSRAWIAIFIYLLGEVLEFKISALNSIGIAAIASFIDHPLCVLHMGFQLSYTATLGIVAFYTPCERWLRILIPCRSMNTLVNMPLYEQIAYYLLVLFRKGLALDMAVNTLTLPLIFYHFGNFPLFSFFYNLVIPCLITVTLFLLLIGFCFSFYPTLSSYIHHLNMLYTEEILSWISNAPRRLDIFIYIPYLSPSMTILTLSAIFLGMLYYGAHKALPYGIFKPESGVVHKA